MAHKMAAPAVRRVFFICLVSSLGAGTWGVGQLLGFFGSVSLSLKVRKLAQSG